eukprot:2946103-Amphidinium_carterae.1
MPPKQCFNMRYLKVSVRMGNVMSLKPVCDCQRTCVVLLSDKRVVADESSSARSSHHSGRTANPSWRLVLPSSTVLAASFVSQGPLPDAVPAGGGHPALGVGVPARYYFVNAALVCRQMVCWENISMQPHQLGLDQGRGRGLQHHGHMPSVQCAPQLEL